jgi:hypothetical protein
VEKISNIVRGNSRVASVDLKSSSAVRPGVPSFGRPVGESPSGPEREGTTASRAAALHSQMTEQRRGGTDRVVEAMADQFFMSRIRRPIDEDAAGPQVTKEVSPQVSTELTEADVDSVKGETDQILQPSGYTPRGSYVDVRA